MKNVGYVVAAYVGAAVLYVGYTLRLVRQSAALRGPKEGSRGRTR